MIFLHRRAARAAAAGIEAAEKDAALRDRVDVAVATNEGGLHEDAALERFTIGERRDRDVQLGAGRGKGRNLGRDHDDGDIAVGDVGGGNLDAEAAGQVRDGLLGELLVGIANAIETGNDAVADELVLARPFDRGDVLDPRLRPRERGAEDEQNDGWNEARVKTVRGIHKVWSASPCAGRR
jgi:hypothetical protein